MTKQEILDASPEQLRILIAEKLGWQHRQDTPKSFVCQEGAPGGWWHGPDYSDGEWLCATCFDPLPKWPYSIELAWELDGEGWAWEFSDDGTAVSAIVRLPGSVKPDAVVLGEAIGKNTKAEAYALARCRAWLLAMEAK